MFILHIQGLPNLTNHSFLALSSILCSPCISVYIITIIAQVSIQQLFLPTLGWPVIFSSYPTYHLFVSEMFFSRRNFISYLQIFLSKYEIEQTIYVIVPGQISPHWNFCGFRSILFGNFAKANQR